MKKNYVLLTLALICFVGNGFAQKCYSDVLYQKWVSSHPGMVDMQKSYDQQIKNALKKIDFSKVMRTTDSSGAMWYDIPIVVHIIHDYGISSSVLGNEYIPDDTVYNMISQCNVIYAAANWDTSNVIAPFKKYIGNPHIRLHLATLDPSGNPTHGITRHRSYLTYTGSGDVNGGGSSDQAKLDDWSPTNYVNIWMVAQIAGNPDVIAYAYWPSEISASGGVPPNWDGVISKAQWATPWAYGTSYDPGQGLVSKVINHELGHVFSLYHTFGFSNTPCYYGCGDDDVDDTPPTEGHCVGTCSSCGCTSYNLYDTTCATNYFKIYPSTVNPSVDSIADYPDTTNAQNIMDYTECSRMFTIGQCNRMWAALNSDQAGRDSLWTVGNLNGTGAFAPFPDLPAIPEFSSTSDFYDSIYVDNPNCACTNYVRRMNYFTCPGKYLRFNNMSWNDTVQTLEWKFSNGASVSDTTLNTPNYTSYVRNSFTQPGWVSTTMIATGNHTTPTTVTWPQTVFVANATGTPALGYFQDFNPGSPDVNSYPMFNYYNNQFKWQISNNAGFYDNYSMEYVGYDSSISTYSFPLTGQPQGDVDDFYTVPFDFTVFGSAPVVNMDYMYSGTSRSSISDNISDTLIIQYSLDGAQTWNLLKVLGKGQLDNNGSIATSYTPSSMSDWAPMTIPLPSNVISSNYVIFRFRYRPNICFAGDLTGFSGGNNFYMDRLNFSPFPAEVSIMNHNTEGIAVVPNPTQNNAYVLINDAANNNAHITVLDITGKIVYTIDQQITNNEARIEIPQSAISVKGIYMVQVSAGSKSINQKLVVE